MPHQHKVLSKDVATAYYAVANSAAPSSATKALDSADSVQAESDGASNVGSLGVGAMRARACKSVTLGGRGTRKHPDRHQGSDKSLHYTSSPPAASGATGAEPAAACSALSRTRPPATA